jgi:hypothetical protein
MEQRQVAIWYDHGLGKAGIGVSRINDEGDVVRRRKIKPIPARRTMEHRILNKKSRESRRMQSLKVLHV